LAGTPTTTLGELKNKLRLSKEGSDLLKNYIGEQETPGSGAGVNQAPGRVSNIDLNREPTADPEEAGEGQGNCDLNLSLGQPTSQDNHNKVVEAAGEGQGYALLSLTNEERAEVRARMMGQLRDRNPNLNMEDMEEQISQLIDIKWKLVQRMSKLSPGPFWNEEKVRILSDFINNTTIRGTNYSPFYSKEILIKYSQLSDPKLESHPIFLQLKSEQFNYENKV